MEIWKYGCVADTKMASNFLSKWPCTGQGPRDAYWGHQKWGMHNLSPSFCLACQWYWCISLSRSQGCTLMKPWTRTTPNSHHDMKLPCGEPFWTRWVTQVKPARVKLTGENWRIQVDKNRLPYRVFFQIHPFCQVELTYRLVQVPPGSLKSIQTSGIQTSIWRFGHIKVQIQINIPVFSRLFRKGQKHFALSYFNIANFKRRHAGFSHGFPWLEFPNRSPYACNQMSQVQSSLSDEQATFCWLFFN